MGKDNLGKDNININIYPSLPELDLSKITSGGWVCLTCEAFVTNRNEMDNHREKCDGTLIGDLEEMD